MKARRDVAPDDSARFPPLGGVLEFMSLIWELDHSLQKTSKRMVSRLGVTAPQRLVIRVAARFPGITAGQMAGLLHLDPGTLSGILERLERKGLLARRVDSRDQRRIRLGLTRKGRLLDVESEGTVESAVRAALSRLAKGKVEIAAEVLREISASLEEARK